jgi:vancomycin resistance protein YoaR
MKNKKVLILLPILIIIAIVLGGGFYIFNNILNVDTIYAGVKVDGISLSGMTKDAASNFLKEQKESEQLNKSMKLKYEDMNFNISLDQLGFKYDYDKALDHAYSLGREGNYFDNFKKIQSLKKNSENIQLESNYDFSKINPIVKEISQKINIESQDAEFDFNGGNFKVKEEVIGRALNEDKLTKLIEENAKELKDIELPVDTVKPEFTKEFYSSINGIIGEYSTSFKGSSFGRTENIRLSAKALSNKLLLPGEELSYNKTTGPRQKQFGYLEAPVIVAGDLTPGIGGGVCQTSTTLYNALLLADMKILERSPHSIPPKYVPKGQDAAVATGYLDLVFKNEFDFPVYTLSKVVGDRVYFYIYGDTTKKNYTVKIEPELQAQIDYTVTENLDETIAPGVKQLVQDGRTGFKVKTYKTIIKDGKIINKTPITSDYYRERNYIYKVGPKSAPKEEPKEGNDSSIGVGEEEAIPLEPVADDPIDKP